MSILALLIALLPMGIARAEMNVPSDVRPGVEPIHIAQANSPTLDDVVFLESRVDRTEAYLGEVISLTLRRGELKYRGLVVQSLYKTRQMIPPDTEGFFSGERTERVEDVERNGFTYTVTTYTLPLFPTQVGESFIGAWRWQGMARGHTGGGARSKQIDKRTAPITINVRSLPPSPADFSGAVGNFKLSAELESTNLTQGVPSTFRLTIEGRGNVQALRFPRVPTSSWYRLGEPVQASSNRGTDRGASFTRSYTTELLPVQDGAFTLAPIVFTYFSPSDNDYVTEQTQALKVTVAEGVQDETLVVVGGAMHGGVKGLVVMDDGRFPLATESGTMHRRSSIRWLFNLLMLMPVALFLIASTIRYGKHWFMGGRAISSPVQRLQDALKWGVDGLRDAIIRDVEGALDTSCVGMTAQELFEALRAAGWGESAAELRWALAQCESFRFGGIAPTDDELQEIAARAAVALVRERRE